MVRNWFFDVNQYFPFSPDFQSELATCFFNANEKHSANGKHLGTCRLGDKGAIQAGKTRENLSTDARWVIDLDIRGFFDNIDHSLMMLAVRKHTREKWILLYIERWL